MQRLVGEMSHWYEKTAVCSRVDNAVERFGSKEALYFEDKRWTFAQINADVNGCARGLIQLGVKPGETVALWMPNRPKWIHMLFALVKVV